MFQMSMINPENRTDQLAQVFPTMGKCDFKVYGPSGTIEKIDVLCILPCNILNEKVRCNGFYDLASFFVS